MMGKFRNRVEIEIEEYRIVLTVLLDRVILWEFQVGQNADVDKKTP